MMNRNQNTAANTDVLPKSNQAERMPIDLVFKRKTRATDLLNFWKRKLASAEKKVRKYRKAKKQYAEKLNVMAR